MDGPTIWAEVKKLFFGEWGLILGVIICVIAIFGIPKWGIGWAAGICAAAIAFFMIPGVLTVLQTWGKALA